MDDVAACPAEKAEASVEVKVVALLNFAADTCSLELMLSELNGFAAGAGT